MRSDADDSDAAADAEYRRMRTHAARFAGVGPASEAVTEWRGIATFAETSFGNLDGRTVTADTALADWLAADGQLEEAIAFYDKALVGARRLQPWSPATGSIAAALGRALDDNGQHRHAFDAHRLAFEIRQQCLDPLDAELNRSRYEVGELSRVLNGWDEAEFYFREALNAEAAAGRPDDEFTAKICNNLADTLIRSGHAAGARELIDRALAIRRSLYGGDSERVARSETTLCAWMLATGDSDGAGALAEVGLARKDSQHSNWTSLRSRALLASGHFHDAIETASPLLEALTPHLADKPALWEGYAELLRVVVHSWLAIKEPDAALAALEPLPDIADSVKRDTIRLGTEARLAAFLRMALELQSLWLAALARVTPNSDQVASAFAYVQQFKALRTRFLRLLQPGAASAMLLEAPSEEAARRDQIAELARLRAALEAGPEPIDEAGRHQRLAMRVRMAEIERDRSASIGSLEHYADASTTNLSTLLPAGAVLIEYVRTQRVGKASGERYVAFLLTANGLEFAAIGLCAEIDDAVAQMRSSLVGQQWEEGEAPPDWLRLSQFLGTRLLSPFLGILSSTSHLIVSPDGALSIIPFEILTLPDGGYALDRWAISYIMRAGELSVLGQPKSQGSWPLILAGPDYNLPSAFDGRSFILADGEAILDRALGGTARFSPLPGAAQEGALVGELLAIEPLIGAWALASELSSAAAPEIVHIATHGFCLPRIEAGADAGGRSGALGNDLDAQMLLADPMQRSGLALSGANAVLDRRQTPAEAERGILLAADIQNLNLQQTDLVVLSACRSGLGPVSIGDGAQGLRRAFLVAGARSVVSTLWDVPDEAASAMMSIFYTELMQEKTRLDALAAARAHVRDQHPRDPLFWAGFVIEGAFDRLARFTPLGDLRIAMLSAKAWGLGSLETSDAAASPAAQRRESVVALRKGAGNLSAIARSRCDDFARLGDLANRLGLHEQSIGYYEMALENVGENSKLALRLRYNIAKILHQSGRLQDAVDAYTVLLEGQLDRQLEIQTRVNQSWALFSLGRLEDAAREATLVIEDSEAPEDQKSKALSNRSMALLSINPKQALADIDCVLGSGQLFEREFGLALRFNRIDLLRRLRDHEGAERQLCELESEFGLSDSMRARIARLRAEVNGPAIAS